MRIRLREKASSLSRRGERAYAPAGPAGGGHASCVALTSRQNPLSGALPEVTVDLMPLTLDQLTAEAMHLPARSRAELAEKLVESLEFSIADEIQTLWDAEAVHRGDEVRSGQVEPIPGEEVIAEVRRIVGR